MSATTQVSSVTSPPLAVQDTSVRVPDAVRSAAARAAEQIAQLREATRADSQLVAGAGVSDSVEPTPAAPATQGFSGGPSGQEGVSPPLAASSSGGEPAGPTSSPPSLEELQRALQRAEHEAATWRGRHRADTARLTEQLEALTKRVNELAEQGVTRNVPDAPPLSESVNVDEFYMNYGKDMVDMVQAVASAAVAPYIKRLEAAIAATTSAVEARFGEVKQSAEAMRREAMFQALAAAVPNYQQIDVDPRFMEWLSQYDPLIRSTRKEVFDTAVRMGDTDSVIAFFRAFLTQMGGHESQVGVGPQSAPPQVVPPASVGRAAATGTPGSRPVSLADFAAPGQARGSGPVSSGTAAPRIWTQQQIAEVYSNIARGRYASDPAGRRAIELEIAAAQREGRVVG